MCGYVKLTFSQVVCIKEIVLDNQTIMKLIVERLINAGFSKGMM